MVLLVAVNTGIFPVPLAAKPMAVLSFAQLNPTLLPPLPLLGLVNTIGVVDVFAHKVWLATAFTVAVGFTVMLNVVAVPTQLTPPLVKVGVTVIVATTGVVVTLVATNVGMLPVPLAAKPIAVLLFVQANTEVPPVNEVLNGTTDVDEPLQATWLDIVLNIGGGFTVMV